MFLKNLSSDYRKFQQFPLGTAAIASYLYPALGGADARNEGGALRAAPPCEPPSRKEFSMKINQKISNRT